MESDSSNEAEENGIENNMSSSTNNSSHASEPDESPNQQSTASNCEENLETNRNEGDNFNYIDGDQMEIRDECDSKSDASPDVEGKKIVKDNEVNRERSRSVSRSVSRERETSISPKKKRSRSNSRGKSRSCSIKRSRSPNRKSGSGGKRRSRSRSTKRSRSRSRRSRSHSRRRSTSRRRRHSRSRRSNSWSRSRRRGRRSRSRSRTPPDGARLHIAEIDVDTSKRDLERLFGKFGRMREVWMAHNPPCFAFVVFDRQRDAVEAQRETNGEQLGRSRIRVTLARPRTRGGKFRGTYDPNMRCYQCGEIGHFSRNCTDTKFGYKRPPSPMSRRGRRHSRSMSRSRSRSKRRSRS